MTAGIVLMLWIVLEAAVLLEVSAPQPICFLYGLGVAFRGAQQ